MYKSFDFEIDNLTRETSPSSYKNPKERYHSDFRRALNGMAPEEICLIPAEPGSGKSTGVQTFIKKLIEDDDPILENGIIVIVSRLKEIRSYIDGCSLAADQFAVVTSGNPIKIAKDYGSLIDANDAPILFTTAQKLIARCGSSFEDMSIYHYRGRARNLRIWDEEYNPAVAAVLDVDLLAATKVVLRSTYHTLVAHIEAIEDESKTDGVTELTIPADIQALARMALATEKGSLSKRDEDALTELAALAGKTVRVVPGPGGARSLVGETKRLPNDLAPLFVLDASGRVSDRYDIMERAGIAVRRMPADRIQYRNARFMHVKMGASKSTLQSSAARLKAVSEAAAIINGSRDKEWLVIHSKQSSFVPKDITVACPKVKIQFIHWGDHRAKNDYRHITKVMCIGLFRYSEAGYDAAHVECCGDAAYRDYDLKRLRLSEAKSHMLQAFTRSNMRNHTAGECGECQIYVIDSERNLKRLVEDTFTGCRFKEIERHAIPLAKRKREILTYILSCDPADLLAGVKRKNVREALKIDSGNFSTYVNALDFKAALAEHGIVVERMAFRAI